MARLPLISRDDLSADYHPVYDHIEETRGRMPNLFHALLNSPEAAERVAALGEYIRYGCPLSDAARETAILSTARELGIHYEWAHHLKGRAPGGGARGGHRRHPQRQGADGPPPQGGHLHPGCQGDYRDRHTDGPHLPGRRAPSWAAARRWT